MSSSQSSLLSQESPNTSAHRDAFHDAGAVTNRVKPVDLTPFPSLSGLRPTPADGSRICVAKGFNCALVDLQNAACSSDLSEAVILQAVWANLLSLYTGYPEVTFLSACPKDQFQVYALEFRITDVCGSAENTPALQPPRNFHHEKLTAQDSLQVDQGSYLDLKHLEGEKIKPGDKRPRQESEVTIGSRCQTCLTIWTDASGVLVAQISSTISYLNHRVASHILDQFEHALKSHIWEDCLPPLSDVNAQCSVLDSSFPSSLLDDSSFEPLHSQFEDIARDAPERLAIEYISDLQSDTKILWSYKILDQKANAFACHLEQAYNVRKNAIVPICMDRCPELYVAILGVLKAGAAWCPIDPSFPARRRCQLVDRTNARVVVVNESSPCDGFPDNVSLVSIFRESQNDEASNWKAPEIGPDDMAYLVWTSGTTGEPKGVPIHHKAASASMRALQCAVPAESRDGKPPRCLQFSHFTFDVFVQDLFYTWGIGGTLVCSDRATMLGSFAALANISGATHAHLTPAFAASVPRASCPTLEVVTMIGEKLTQSVADDWSRDMQLFNTYGPAETTVVSTLRLVPHEDVLQSANVGFPLSSVSAFVMRNQRPVGRNCIGELALAGPQLSKGYWRDPEKTQSRFLYNEYLETVLYMTGDTVRLLSDGSLEFLGRTDDLVKIQGIRIELSEISYALCNCHSMIQQIEVTLLDRPDRPSRILVAFLAVPSLETEQMVACSAEAADIARAALQEAQATLPEYMIPKVFLVVAHIPRTSSAKIDRARLAHLYASADLGEWETMLSVLPSEHSGSDWTETEAEIVDIVANITGTLRTSIRRESPLPSIGIDSIAATRLVTDLHTRHVEISLLEVLQCRHLGDLISLHSTPDTSANRLDHLQHDLIACLDLTDHVSLVAPCLPLQEALLAETCQNASAYWSNSFFRISADADLDVLRKAWVDVTVNTDALRLSFISVQEMSRKPSVDATFLQVFSKDPTIDFISIETSRPLLEAQAKQRASEIARNWQGANFRIAPWAITVFALQDDHVMMVTIHHSICDELSIRSLVNDVHCVYQRREPRSRNQFGNALATLLPRREKSDGDEKFWTAALVDFQDSDDQRIWPSLRSDNKSPSGSITRVWQLRHSYQDFQDRAIELGASSVVSLLRLVWGYVLHEYLETDRVVFGETWSARGEASGYVDVIGPMLYTVPTPFEISGTAREAVRRLDDFQFHARQHLNFHPRNLRRMLGYSRSRILYPAILNFIPESGNEQNWTQMDDVVGLSVEHPIALNATLSSSHQALTFELVADSQHMDGEHLEILSHQVDALLDEALRNPDRPLRLLSSFLPPDLLSTVGGPSHEVREVNRESPVHWINYYEEHHPDWPAVEAVSLQNDHLTSKIWSYRELQRASMSVAKIINDFGFRKRLIGVCLEHSLEVHAVILGIMASNNVYLPIAQDLPVERKRFLINDSQAAILFTSKSSVFDTSSTTCKVSYVEDLTNSPGPLPLPALAQPTDGAYLLYTSGSTGAPKGVHVGRGNLVSFIEAISTFICRHVEMDQLQGRGKYLGMASYAFDVHLLEMFFAWRHGMTTVSAPRSLLLDDLEVILQKYKVTHASFVPSLVDSAGIHPENLPDLRYMSVGGEMITQKVIDTWAKSHVVVANAYGPTEATIGCCFKRVTTDMNVRNIGTPLAYTAAHVLQPESFQYALRNTPGELCLTGALVANGYFHRPDAKGFIDNFNGQKMYRTGDRVRLMANGSLEFLGRKDDQTKIRGQRIELGEVSEAVRSAVVAVSNQTLVEVASLVSQHPTLARPQLVTFVAGGPKSDDERLQELSNAETIRDICRRSVPAYMVPDHILTLNRLPLVKTSRKVDTKRLALLFSELSMDINNATSSNDMDFSSDQKLVCVVVKKTLGLDAKATANLFSHGLDSLNAIALTVALRECDFCCTVSDVLRNPSIEKLAKLPRLKIESSVDPVLSVDLRTKLVGINGWQEHESDILCVRKCLPLQETLVASSLDEREAGLYINHVILRLSPQIDLLRLINAWEMTFYNHEILRTCFAEIDNRFVQVVLCHRALSCFRQVTESPLERLVTKRPAVAADILAKLFIDPPVRLRFATSSTASFLQISIHHALYDAQSFNMILCEVHARYSGSRIRSYTSMGSLLDYVSSQDQVKAKAFWQHYLHNFKPALFTHKESSNSISVRRKLFLSYSKLEQLAISLQSTSASVIQAVFGVALAQTLGEADVVFGAVLSGRTVPISGAESIVAPSITTIPQRVTCTDRRLEGIVRSAHDGFVDSLEYQFSALRDIHRWTKADGPLFDSLFTYTKTPKSDHGLWQETEGSMSSGFPLAVEVEVSCDDDEVYLRCDALPTFGDRQDAVDLLEKIFSLVSLLSNKEQMSLNGRTKPIIPVTATPNGGTNSSGYKKEQELRRAAADLLGRSPEDIPSETSFFTLGIDSILAIQFIKRLRQAGIVCSTADVMRNASIERLSRHLIETDSGARNRRADGEKSTTEHAILVPVLPLTEADMITKQYYCTPLQSSMLTQTLGSEGQLYVHQHCIRLDTDVDRNKLRTAWGALVKGLEILRTSFHFDEIQSVWTAAVHQDIPDRWHQLQDHEDMYAALSSIRGEFFFQEETDFRLPPWRMDLFQDLLILTLHHSLYDGEALYLLFRQLADTYATGKIDPTPPFSHVADIIHANSLQAHGFWLDILKGFRPVKSLSRSTETMRQITRRLTLDLSWVLTSCKERGVTLQAVALLAFGQALAQDSGLHDIVFGHVVRGRSIAIPFIDDIIGPLFNTTPFRLDPKTLGQSYGDAVEAIQNFIVASQAYQYASLPMIQHEWQKSSHCDEVGLIDDIFVFQKQSADSVSEMPWTTVQLTDERDSTEHGFNFEVEQGLESITISANSSKGTDLQQFVARFESNVHGILACPHDKNNLVHVESASTQPVDIVEPTEVLGPNPQLLDQLRHALSKASQVPAKDISDLTSIRSLGLDSISAIKMVSASRKLGLKMSVIDIIQGQNLLGIAARLREQKVDSRVEAFTEQERQRALTACGVRPEDVDKIVRCLAGQEYNLRRWLKSSGTMSEATFTLRASQRLDQNRLLKAWRSLRTRHSILRTVFTAISDQVAAQVILKPSAVRSDAFSSVEVPDEGALVKHYAEHRFDLFSPPCALVLFKLQNVVLLKIHHVLYDALSLPILFKELDLLYRGQTLETAPGMSFDFRRQGLERSSSFWTQSLQGCEPTFLRSALGDAAALGFFFSKKQVSGLGQLDKGISLANMIIIAFARTLTQSTSVSNPMMGLFHAGRSLDSETTTLPCLNLTPLAIRDVNTRSARELLGALSDELAARMPFEQDYLGDILQHVECHGKPLFNALINIHAYQEQKPDEEEQVLRHWTLPGSATPTVSKICGRTAVDMLSTEMLTQSTCFLDVDFASRGDSVVLTARCDRQACSEEECKSLLENVTHQLNRLVEEVR